jgi:hypothetical protein
METDMDFNARFAAITADRTARGLMSATGIACATAEQRDFENAKTAARMSGKRDAATTAALTIAKAKAVASIPDA